MCAFKRAFASLTLALLWSAAVTCAQLAPTPPSSPAPQDQATVLDHVVAVVNGSVILESDVDEEMRFAVFQSSAGADHNTAEAALQRLIDRDLIQQQIKVGRPIAPPADQQVREEISGLRKQIPQCVPYHCETEVGWQAFLHAEGLTEEEFQEHWRQRILILSFIENRFGAGVHISPEEVEEYYEKVLVPPFAPKKIEPPPLATVSSRIQEILLEQRVNALLDDWLQSLKNEGSVSILDPAYGQVGTTGSGEDNESGDQP